MKPWPLLRRKTWVAHTFGGFRARKAAPAHRALRAEVGLHPVGMLGLVRGARRVAGAPCPPRRPEHPRSTPGLTPLHPTPLENPTCETGLTVHQEQPLKGVDGQDGARPGDHRRCRWGWPLYPLGRRRRRGPQTGDDVFFSSDKFRKACGLEREGRGRTRRAEVPTCWFQLNCSFHSLLHPWAADFVFLPFFSRGKFLGFTPLPPFF